MQNMWKNIVIYTAPKNGKNGKVQWLQMKQSLSIEVNMSLAPVAPHLVIK